MRSFGRFEKRVAMAVPVYLGSLGEPRPFERALTENVSPHGARVSTERLWQLDEEPLITPLANKIQLSARVVYCRPLTNGRFSVGLEFRERSVDWAKWPRG